jgi:hypothetical protein
MLHKVPSSVRKNPIPIDGCKICGCMGCASSDMRDGRKFITAKNL